MNYKRYDYRLEKGCFNGTHHVNVERLDNYAWLINAEKLHFLVEVEP